MWEEDDKGKTVQKHVFTHFVSLVVLEKSIIMLKQAAAVIKQQYGGILTNDACEKIAEHGEYSGDEIRAWRTDVEDFG